MGLSITNAEQENVLLNSQAQIWNVIFSFINPLSLKCAIQLDIPDIVHNHGKPMTVSELTSALPMNQAKAPTIFRLMRILVHLGFFTKQKVHENEEEEGYVLTPTSRLLLKDEPLSVRPFLLAMLDPDLIKPWHHLSDWLQNDNPTPFDTAHGRSFWEHCGDKPRLGHLFEDSMANDSRLVMIMVLKENRGVFEGLNSLVDVGGGTGTAARTIADEFPNMNCMVLDQPHVVSGLNGGKNLSFIGGDMFLEIPPADAVLLKWILHDWSDEKCIEILKKCKEAIPNKDKGGKIIIIDMMLANETEDEKSLETQLYFDMLMMVLQTGKERNKKEWAKLFYDAGFSDYKITPIQGLRSLIEAFP